MSVEKANVGDVFVNHYLPEDDCPDIVQESCGESTRGNWVCITCGEAFGNQMQKDNHILYGNHKLAWNCLKHGLEVP